MAPDIRGLNHIFRNESGQEGMVPATYVEEIATYDDPTDDQSFSSESEGKKSNLNEHGPRDEPDGEPDLGNEEYEDS